MTTGELLEESQQLLNRAASIEDQRRSRVRGEGLRAELARCSAAAHAHRQASGQPRSLEIITDQAREGVEALRSTATGSGRRQADNRIYEHLLQAVSGMSEAHRGALREIVVSDPCRGCNTLPLRPGVAYNPASQSSWRSHGRLEPAGRQEPLQRGGECRPVWGTPEGYPAGAAGSGRDSGCAGCSRIVFSPSWNTC